MAGQIFTRTMKALGVARGDPNAARGFVAGQPYANRQSIDESLKAVSAVGTGDIGAPSPAAYDLSEFLRPLTVVGKLIGTRHAPARTRLISATAGSAAYWSGEAQPRPISRLTLAGETIEPLGVTAITVVTNELLTSSLPFAEALLSRDLAAANVSAIDTAFLDAANRGEAGARPASITNGTTPIFSTGSSLAQIDADLAAMIDALSTAGSDLTFATFVMRPRTAGYLSRVRGAGGALAFPGMSAKGGVLLGFPCITTAAMPVEAGSPGNGNTSIVLLDPSQILVVDDGGGAFEASTEGAILMEDEQTSGASSLISLWQTESAALKTTRFINWRRCRDGIAQVLTGVTY